MSVLFKSKGTNYFSSNGIKNTEEEPQHDMERWRSSTDEDRAITN